MNIQILKKETLKYFWGYNAFRDLQEEIIDAVLQGKDVLALLPTGGGKSLCYQLPALISEGICLVVSPLLALMKDQVSHLKTMGVQAEYLSSELDERQEEEIYNKCKEGCIKLLYISPERLSNKKFLNHIQEIYFSFIAVDEAHCISEWGQDFRPSYQFISRFRNEFKNIPCLALTATATPNVLKEIEQKLQLKKTKIFQKSFRRNNLKIQMLEISDKYDFILKYLKKNPLSGIIYVRTRKDAEQLTLFLKNKGLDNIDYYHAGLSISDKHKRQKKWQAASNFILITTNAFGMGINKDNVRFVMHYSPSPSIENYYQEIGRAGRDGEIANAILLWNSHEINEFDDILKNQIVNREVFNKIISFIYSIYQIADGEERNEQYELNINRIKNFTKVSLASIKNVLNFLHNQEIIYYNDAKIPSTLELKFNTNELDMLSQRDAYLVELLLRNLPGIQSYKVNFSEEILSQKIGTDPLALKERLQELKSKDLVDYIDGSAYNVRFLKPRNERLLNKYWTLFKQIQQNKIQKWEEIKYFIKNNHFCKMKMILAYFGEKNINSCGKCNVCLQRKIHFINGIKKEIKKILQQAPASIEAITVALPEYRKEQILDELILLLNTGEVRMMGYQTYALNDQFEN